MNFCRLTAQRCLYNQSRATLTAAVLRNAVATPCASSLSYTRTFSTGEVVQAGSAGKHWYSERVVAVGLLAVIPAGFVYPNPVVDYSLAVLIPLHGHWGFMAIVEDYAPQVLKGLGKALVYLLSIGSFAALMYLNVKDVGICGAVKALWSL